MTMLEAGADTVDAYVVPVSFAQERLWMLDRMDPGSAAYAVPIALRLRGALDLAALRGAFAELAMRHESLRTVFRWMDGGPAQVVFPEGALPVQAVDLAGVDADVREAELRRRLADEAARPFDLEAGPLVRVSLYRLAEHEHVLLVNLHHIVTDGWSNGVLLRELGALYGAFARGQQPALPEPPLQYADYAEWQRERLRGAFYDAQLAYWRAALDDAPALLELPLDRPRPAVWEGRGATEGFTLPRGLVASVEALARAEGATPFMVLLAAYQLLLGRYARQDDVVVGTPVANRARPETHGVVGFFVNTLALRADLSGAPTFRALLRRVRETTLGAFAHQEMPFERLVDELRVPRSAAHAPVFQAMFILQNAPAGTAALPGLEVEPVAVEGTQAPFDLTLALRARDGEMEGAVEYATALFDRATAAGIAAHFRTLLASACATPDAPAAALPMMTAEEVQAAVRTWEGAPLASPCQPIHRRIAEQAARTPGALALESADGLTRLTYAELDARADRLSHRLRGLGVRGGSLVAIRAERSVDTITAILAVLKAGGAYLPVDPAYPADRQAYMLNDSRAALLLDGTGAGAPEGFPGRTAGLAAEIGASALEPAGPLEDDEADPRHPAYVIYTSGSTGRPKGVAVAHHNLAWYSESVRLRYGILPSDRMLQFAPLSFDTSVEEIFPTLATGAALVLRDDEPMQSVAGFWRACARHAVSIVSLPTAYWHELSADAERTPPAVPQPLRMVILAGEKALPDRAAAWLRAVPPRVLLINSYGPTENTVVATVWDVREADPHTVPIGPPLPGARVRVLDPMLRPVPAGVPGELFTGGGGVVRGYLHRPGLTAERFVPDPLAPVPGARLYRTGDLVRWRADGVLEFVGRTDDQVKVRGFRIEPGEIEALLRRQPHVRDGVVAVREDTPGDRRLVAYLVPADPELSVDAVRGALRAALPAYMLPSTFVTLDALPLSPAGKVNRKALPAPRAQAAAAPAAGALTQAERAVAALWTEVLGADAVGPEDNFFDLGGNSLLLIRLAGRIQDVMGKAITPVDLFRFPTVRALAAHLDGGGEAASSAAPASDRAERLRAGTGRLLNLKKAR